MIMQKLSNQMLFKALEKTKHGSITLTIREPFANHRFGEGPVVSELSVSGPRTLAEIARGGDVGLADAILRGDLVISDEAAFIQWACLNDETLKQSFHGSLLGTLLPRLQSWFRPNTVDGAKRNIMAHYDLGNDFYQKWLDPSMSYSSALFAGDARDEQLIQAQYRKYDRIIDELGLTANDHVLEVGCGWGGFFSRAVERTGCRVTAVMNSPAQAAHNRELIKAKGLESHVDLKLIDYRHIEGRFDKLVSIEMIEAVGQAYWPTYFNKLSNALKSKGRALIQSITIREDRFDEYTRTPDFINTMIFPGGMLLTNSAIHDNALASGIATAARPFEFGLCYAETLRRWKTSFLSASQQGRLPSLDERFVNLWRFYLAYCEGAFNAQRINVGQFLLEKTS